MLRTLPAAFLLMTACQSDPVEDRFSLTVDSGAPLVALDLNPLTVVGGIDNNIDIAVIFAAPEGGFQEGVSIELATFTQYRIEYMIDYETGREEAPFIAGDIALEVFEGGQGSVPVRAAIEAQLDWINERYTGDEMDVRTRVSVGGVYEETEAILITQEYITTFADYQ